MDKVQKPNNSECNKPSSESVRFYIANVFRTYEMQRVSEEASVIPLLYVTNWRSCRFTSCVCHTLRYSARSSCGLVVIYEAHQAILHGIKVKVSLCLIAEVNSNLQFPNLIVGFCILLRVYPLIRFLKTTVRNNVFVIDFIVHYLLHVSAPIGGHLQVICT
jgi:hypothetical protein